MRGKYIDRALNCTAARGGAPLAPLRAGRHGEDQPIDRFTLEGITMKSCHSRWSSSSIETFQTELQT